MNIYCRRWLSALLMMVSVTLHAEDKSPRNESYLGKLDLKSIAVYLKGLVSDPRPAPSAREESRHGPNDTAPEQARYTDKDEDANTPPHFKISSE